MPYPRIKKLYTIYNNHKEDYNNLKNRESYFDRPTLRNLQEKSHIKLLEMELKIIQEEIQETEKEYKKSLVH